MKTGFFAYSGKPYSVGESIEEAIESDQRFWYRLTKILEKLHSQWQVDY